MIVTLVVYIITIIIPFLPFNKNFSYNIKSVKRKISLKKMYWLWITILFSFISITTETYADIGIYTNIFEWTNAGDTNFDTLGWSLLCRFFYWTGLNYRGMIPFIILASMYVMSRAFRRINLEEDKVFAGMMIFPGLMNMIQLKFFLASSIIIYAVTFLQRNEKRHILKYIIGVILATLVHSASIFCLVYLLVIMFERVNVQKSILYTLLGISGMLIFFKFVPSVASRFLNEQVVLRYFAGAVEVSSANWIIAISLAWILMVTIAWIVIKSSNGGKTLTKDETMSIYTENIRRVFISRSFTIICLTGIILPLLMYDQNFHRFVQIEYIIGFELLSLFYQSKLIREQSNRCIIAVIVIISIFYCVRYFVIFDKVIPLFNIDGFVPLLR